MPDKKRNTDEKTESLQPLHWLEEHGDALFAYAHIRIGKRDVAEDLVQDTLLAGIEGLERFERGSAVRTWLTSILKRKIVDYFRRNEAERRHIEKAAGGKKLPEGEPADGGWSIATRRWRQDPATALQAAEFWRVFHACRSKMPRLLQAVFALREMDQKSSQEVCKELGITPSNMSVRIFRARLHMRRCLESNWFRRESDPS